MDKADKKEKGKIMVERETFEYEGKKYFTSFPRIRPFTK